MKFNLLHLVTAPLGECTIYRVQEEAQILDETLEIDFLRGELQFTRVNRGIFAQGHLETQVELTCVRCLEPFSYPLGVEVAEHYLLARQDGDEEPVFLILVDGTVDVTEPARQQIWVNLPIQPLCRPDCQGLCAQCGVNLNHESCVCQEEAIDPRLEMLKELL